MESKIISILGCGWLGLPLAEQLVADGHIVKGSTTSVDKLPLLEGKGIRPYRILLNPLPEGDDLHEFLNADVVIIDVPPRAGKQGDAFHPQQIRGVTDALRGRSGPYVVYVSSTSIYPDLNREVREEEVVLPDDSAAPALVEAEQQVLALGNATVLRCGGLLGYERIPGKYVAGKKGLTTGAVPVNYIHRDDAVGMLRQLVIHPQPNETFNAVAPLHPSREAIYRKNCADFAFELPSFSEPEKPEPFKLISSRKWSDRMEYTYRYPDPLQFYYKP